MKWEYPYGMTCYQRDFMILMQNEINEREKDTQQGGGSFADTKREVRDMWDEIESNESGFEEI
ncbi:hypothetical protein LQ226_20625 [Pontibacillus sp. HN14]|nr:hypothetical protein [Pontibacillus sp. HN14]